MCNEKNINNSNKKVKIYLSITFGKEVKISKNLGRYTIDLKIYNFIGLLK